MSKPPLSGIVVLDLTQIFNGPYATFLLAAAGATVIKIEPPGGEHLRKRTVNKASQLPYAMLNAGKKSLMLDLKSAKGKEILLELAKKADVLVENFAVGVMDKLGLGAEVLKALNPRLIYASSSGYGKTGPYQHYPAMDLTMQAMTGIINATGFQDSPPVKAGPAVSDFLSGIHLYGAITTALLGRERNGQADEVEVSMMEASYFALSSNLGMVFTGEPNIPARTGNRHGALIVCPYNVYPAKDGFVAIIVNHDEHWRKLCTAMNRCDLIEDAAYKNNASRIQRIQTVDDLVGAWTQNLSRKTIFDQLIESGVPCAPVRDLNEVMHDPHLQERGSLTWVDHPEYGHMPLPASPLRFNGEASRPQTPSSPLGADKEELLQTLLHMSVAEIQALEKQGVI
jgi:CoA:oxalate CoA-transferase